MMPVIMRIRLSVPPPGANGTTTSTVFVGYLAWAVAPAGSAAAATRAADCVTNVRRVSIGVVLLR